MQSTRRNFVTSITGLGALAMFGSLACRSSDDESANRIDAWFDISLAQWSNHRALRGGLSNLDWITSVPEKYGINAVEFVNSFFKDKAGDEAYLAEMKSRASDAGVSMLLIMVDGEGSLAARDKPAREKAIANHRRWVDAAGVLGCHSLRVNAAGSGESLEMQARAADSLVELAEYATPHNLNIIVENHGGRSSNGKWLAGVMTRANHPRVGTLPDFGNFKTGPDEEYDRYLGVLELMPFAKAVSAKSHEFDDGGNEVRTDYRRMLQIVKEAGYRGHIGVEYEGSQYSEDEGILKTKELLLRVRSELS